MPGARTPSSSASSDQAAPEFVDDLRRGPQFTRAGKGFVERASQHGNETGRLIILVGDRYGYKPDATT